MKLTPQVGSLGIQFAKGGATLIRIPEIVSIYLQTIETMTVDVDLVCLNHENGDFFEISDEAEGFTQACDYLSAELGICPDIRTRFPVIGGQPIKIYSRNEN